MAQLILPLLLFVGMYMLLIRPQQQKAKAQRALVGRASAGDRVMLTSGIYGTLTEVLATTAYLEVAEGIEILVNRQLIQDILDDFPTDELDAADHGDVEDDDVEDDDVEDTDDVQDAEA
ncbi:MAG: preprotein translocase subunit YajC [Verrucomicrobiales bacterium]|jgi:preprotein translocase subunit YajC